MQWLQVPNQRKVDNLNNVRRKARRDFRKNVTIQNSVFVCSPEGNSTLKTQTQIVG